MSLMSNEVLINAIKSISNGIQPDVDVVKFADFLNAQNCKYFLSCLTTSNKYTDEIVRRIKDNKYCVEERYKVSRGFFEFMNNENIPYAVVKGAVLSGIIYKDPFFRCSGDIDIILNTKFIPNVKQFLCNNGFVQGRIVGEKIIPFSRNELIFYTTSTHQIAPFVKKTDNVNCPFVEIDINFDIMWGENNKKTDMDFVLNNTDFIEICGVKVQKLISEMEFISLCLHHYKDMNSIYLISKGRMNLNLLCDILLYVRNTELDTYRLYSYCQKLNVIEYVYYCLFYTNLIFDDPKVSKYCTILKTENGDKILDSFGLNDNERKEWDLDFMDRMFSPESKQHFIKLLSLEQLKKIEVNTSYM